MRRMFEFLISVFRSKDVESPSRRSSKTSSSAPFVFNTLDALLPFDGVARAPGFILAKFCFRRLIFLLSRTSGVPRGL